MAKGIGTIQVKREGKQLVVQGLGSTPRGTKFIKNQVVLKSKKTSDPGFKDEVTAAINELLA